MSREGYLVPDDVSHEALIDESNRLASKAGYCNRDGSPKQPSIMAVVNWGPRHLNLWPRDKNGQLIE